MILFFICFYLFYNVYCYIHKNNLLQIVKLYNDDLKRYLNTDGEDTLEIWNNYSLKNNIQCDKNIRDDNFNIVKELNLTDKIDIIYSHFEPACFGSPYYFIKPIIFLNYEDNMKFILYHELFHIKQNHEIIRKLLITIVFYISSHFSFKIGFLIQIILSLISNRLCLRNQERDADLFACKHCSITDLNKIIKYFERIRNDKLKIPQTFLTKFYDFYDTHPPLQERIDYINEEISLKS